MKKIYISPCEKIVKLATTSMMAASPAATLTGSSIESADQFGARGYDFDDEEE